MRSIRQSLLIWLILGMMVAICIAGLSSYYLAQDEANELFDYQIKQVALSLHGQSQPTEIAVAADEDPEEDNVIPIWDTLGKPLFTSYPTRALPRYVTSGLHTVNYHQQPWRIYNTQRHGQFIQVAQPMTVRNELAAGLAVCMYVCMYVNAIFRTHSVFGWVDLVGGRAKSNAIASCHHCCFHTSKMPCKHWMRWACRKRYVPWWLRSINC